MKTFILGILIALSPSFFYPHSIINRYAEKPTVHFSLVGTYLNPMGLGALFPEVREAYQKMVTLEEEELTPSQLSQRTMLWDTLNSCIAKKSKENKELQKARKQAVAIMSKAWNSAAVRQAHLQVEKLKEKKYKEYEIDKEEERYRKIVEKVYSEHYPAEVKSAEDHEKVLILRTSFQNNPQLQKLKISIAKKHEQLEHDEAIKEAHKHFFHLLISEQNKQNLPVHLSIWEGVLEQAEVECEVASKIKPFVEGLSTQIKHAHQQFDEVMKRCLLTLGNGARKSR